MNKRTIVVNTIWSIIHLAISAATTMFILPYVSEKIGIEAYGYIGLGSNIISYIDLIASTINVYAIQFISQEYHRGNFQKAESFYSSVFYADIIMAITVTVIAVPCILNLEALLDIPSGLVIDVKLLFALILINYILSIIGTVFGTAAFVKDLLHLESKYKAIGTLLKGIFLVAIFLLQSTHVWHVAVASIFCTIFILATKLFLTKRYLPEVSVRKHNVSASAIIEIVRNGIWNTVAQLGNLLNSGLDLLVSNIYLGAYDMGVLSVPKTLSVFIDSLLSSAVMAFRPQLLQFYSKDNMEQLKNGFLLSMKYCGLFACVFFSVFSGMGIHFLKLWIPSQDIILIYRIALLTFFADVFTGFVKPLHYGCILKGKLKVPCIGNLLIGLFNVLSMIVLLSNTNMGLYAVAVTTIIGNIGYNFGFMPVYMTSLYGIGKKEFYGHIFRYVVVCMSLVVICFFCGNNLIIESWISLIIWGGIFTLLSGCLYILLVLNIDEKRALIRTVKSKIKFNGR